MTFFCFVPNQMGIMSFSKFNGLICTVENGVNLFIFSIQCLATSKLNKFQIIFFKFVGIWLVVKNHLYLFMCYFALKYARWMICSISKYSEKTSVFYLNNTKGNLIYVRCCLPNYQFSVLPSVFHIWILFVAHWYQYEIHK